MEVGEDGFYRVTEGAFDFGARLGGGEWRHLVLQLGQLLGEVLGQQVAARRQHLAKLDEDRAERFQGLAQARRARLGKTAPRQRRADERGEPAAGRGGEQKFLKAEAQRDGKNA